MFNIGDKVVYPNHGAGTIVGIETKNILGKENKYYIMKLPIGEDEATGTRRQSRGDWSKKCNKFRRGR